MKDWSLDKVIHWTTGLVVTIVAFLAALKSYEHIYILGHHDPILPLCIDGMIIAASLVLLTASRASFGTLWFARLTLWLGIAATMGANLAYGLPQGWEAGTRAIWPAVCFVFTELTVMQLAKAKKKRRATATVTRRTPETASKPDRKLNVGFPAVKAVSPGPLPVAAVKTATKPPERVNTVPGKVPSIRTIRDHLGCGQPIAEQVQEIMKDMNVSIDVAKQIRDERKADAKRSKRN